MVLDENSTMASPLEQTLPLPFPTTFELVASFAYYGVLWLVILIGNLLVIVSYQSNWRVQTVTNLFVASLAVNDLMVAFISIPSWIYSYSCKYYQGVVHPAAYEFYITLDVFIGCASIMLLTAISLERCVAIVTPMKHRALNVSKFQTMIVLAWAFALVVAAMYPIQLKHWQSEYTTFVFLTCFLGPLGVIMVVYTLVYKTAVRSKFRVYPLGIGATLHREIRVASTIALVTGIFIAAWLPFFVVTLIATYDLQSLPEPPTLFRLIAFVKALHYANSAVNPFVYGYRSLEMRRTMKRLLAKLFCVNFQTNRPFLDSRKRSGRSGCNQDNAGSNTSSTTQLPRALMVTVYQGDGVVSDLSSFCSRASLSAENEAATPTCSSRLTQDIRGEESETPEKSNHISTPNIVPEIHVIFERSPQKGNTYISIAKSGNLCCDSREVNV